MTHRPARYHRRAGFSLIELLMSLGLLVTLAFCIQSVLLGAQNMSHAAGIVSDNSLAWNNAIARLRADAWQAIKFSQNNPDELQIQTVANTIRWQISPEGSLTRDGVLLNPHTPGQSFTITAAGPVLHCSSFDLQLTSPVLLMQKELP